VIYLTEDLFNKHMHWAKGKAIALSNDKIREDAIQEAIMGLWKACQTFNDNKGIKFKTYASRVITNAVYDFMRKEKHQTKGMIPLGELKDYVLSADDTPEVELERKDLNKKITEACGNMTDRERCVLVQRMLARKPMSLQKIATAWHTSKMSIKRDESRLKNKIEESMNGEWYSG